MKDAVWSVAALQDLEHHFDWLDQRDRRLADRITGDVVAKACGLVENPLTGSPLDTGGLRKSLIAGTKFLIVYRYRKGIVEIARIRHASENWRPT